MKVGKIIIIIIFTVITIGIFTGLPMYFKEWYDRGVAIGWAGLSINSYILLNYINRKFSDPYIKTAIITNEFLLWLCGLEIYRQFFTNSELNNPFQYVWFIVLILFYKSKYKY